jgi:predicted amidophosphoribosyltransferase
VLNELGVPLLWSQIVEHPAGEEVNMRFTPKHYECPACKADFSFRKEKRCPACNALLLIASDNLARLEPKALKKLWLWEPLQRKWVYILDWDQNLRDAVAKLDLFGRSSVRFADVIEFPRRPK